MRVLFTLILLCAAALAGAREDWGKITALDAAPPVAPKSEEDARAAAVLHSARQEAALRAYLAAYPADAHGFELRLRLARVLSLRADLHEAPVPPEVAQLLRDAEILAATPAERAEIDFARLAQDMRQSRTRRPTAAERADLLSAVRTFERSHPADRRLGSLLAEVATLFDGDSKTKQRLLADAKKLTKDPDLLAQIADDTKRLTWLGRALPLRFTAIDGTRVDVKNFRGKPVVVVFFAMFSQPSRAVLANMHRLAETFGAGFIALSLDPNPTALAKYLADEKLPASVACDGKSWDSPLIQALGINALPCVWLLDKQGLVRTLDPLDAPEDLLRQLDRAP